MGKLFSRPKAPEPPQIVYEPAPAPAPPVYAAPTPVYVPPPVFVQPPVPTPAPQPTAAPSQPAAPASPDPETEASQARVQSLLRRRRGRAGTIETSWRGVLSQSAAVPTRKSLLGD